MSQMRVKTVSFQLERPKVFQWRRLKSFFSRKKRLPTSKCEGVRTEGEQKTPRSTIEGNIDKQSPKFQSRRRFAICSVVEEEGRCYRIPLAESRRNLVIVHSLIDSGLL